MNTKYLATWKCWSQQSGPWNLNNKYVEILQLTHTSHSYASSETTKSKNLEIRISAKSHKPAYLINTPRHGERIALCYAAHIFSVSRHLVNWSVSLLGCKVLCCWNQVTWSLQTNRNSDYSVGIYVFLFLEY